MVLKITKKVKVDNTQKIKEMIEQLHNKSIHIGIFGQDDSFMLMIARVQEFGVTITPKNGQRLCVPVNPNSVGKSPRSFDGLFTLKDKNGELWLCKNKGKGDFDFYYWLPSKVTIPSRSFIRGTYNNKQSEIQSFIGENLDLLFTFKISVDTFLNKIGIWLVGLTQKYLTDLKEPPKSEITLAAYPGKTNPLINSGKLRQSIVYKIV